MEWIKLYGLLLGKEKEATAFFDNEIQKVSQAISQINNSENKKTVAFFYVTSNGYVNVRKPNDYISKMIEMTGGQYALNSLIIEEENALSTVNLSWEDFYAYGKEADILIYNSTIDGGIHTYNELLEKNALFADFKAVQEGTVFCTSKNMFQESSMLADIIVELSYVLNGKIENCKYILPLS